jgi:protein FAM50
MTDIKRFGDSGVHTVEGNVAGERAMRLTQEREQQQREYENIKKKIKDQNASKVAKIGDKFNCGR